LDDVRIEKMQMVIDRKIVKLYNPPPPPLLCATAIRVEQKHYQVTFKTDLLIFEKGTIVYKNL
jgi:hypothetical protein